MNKKFTKLMAALALLVFMAPNMVGWGQTKTTGDILNETFEDNSSTASNWSFNTVSGHSNGYAQIDAGSAMNGSKGLHLGSGNNAFGSATTPTLSGMTANATMTFWAKTNGNNHSLKLSATGCTIDQSSIVIANGTWTQYTVNITNGTTSAVINFYKDGSTKKYIYIDDVVITSVASYVITAASNNDSWGTVSLSGSTITASPAEGCRYASPAYTVSPENSATVSQNGDEFTVTPSANTTVTINFEPIPTYTVTLGDDDSTLTEIIGGAGVTLPIRSDIGGYSFEGWSETNVSTETTTAPTTLFSAGTYHPTSNITLYPIYSRTESGSGTTDETVSVNISKYATEHGWGSSSSVGQKSITINSDVTAECNSGTNSGKYYNDGWRIYQNEGGAVTIATTNGELKLVTFTFTVANTGTFNYNSSVITSGTAVEVSGTSAVFTVDNSGTATNGQVRITAISVTYTITGTTTTYYLSSPTPYPYSVIYDSNGVEVFVDQETTVFSLAAPSNVPTGFNFAGWTMVGTEGINVESLLSGENIDLSDYETDNATLVAVFSREEGAVPGDFELVTESLSDWSGNYLIAYDDETFADGRIGGTDGIGKQNSSVDPGTNLSNDVVNASWGNTYYVTLEKVGGNAEGYLMKTQDGKYNYQTSNSNGLSATNNRETAAGYPLSVTLDANGKFEIAISAGAVFHYNASGYFRFYRDGGQNKVVAYKQGVGTSGVTKYYTRVFQNETPTEDVFILGPSIIPSGSYLDMGEYEILSEDAELFIIEDGAQLISNCYDVNATVLKNIRGRQNGGGWNFVASPIFFEANPTAVGMITTSVYDLYRFNPNVEPDNDVTYEWENYKVHNSTEDPFLLYNGYGYLYANLNDVTLEFAGVVNDPDAIVSYDYDENSESEWKDWHLVGNPYMYNAYANTSYYVISDNAIAEPEIGGAPVAPCQGIMIQGTTGSVDFTIEPASNSTPSNLQLTVAQQVMSRNSEGSMTLNDKAIISFNEGDQLGKFYFGENDANIYIPQNGKEYAIVSAEAQGEMPVNFRATKNGTYTLTINPEGVEMNYLHLIDNMTGANIDLLQTPSYTFNASMNDYESRFKLVFAAGSSTGSEASETFAFFTNGELIVNNEGEATLQVVDMTGRILSSQSLNGNGSVQMAAPVGVYVLRLISGNEVKTQKIVVR